YDYGARIYNPRLGRFLSEDPLAGSYPGWSPYAYAMDRCIQGVDLDGLEFYPTNTAFTKVVTGDKVIDVYNVIQNGGFTLGANNLVVTADERHFTKEMKEKLEEAGAEQPDNPEAPGAKEVEGTWLGNTGGAISLFQEGKKFIEMPKNVEELCNPLAEAWYKAGISIQTVNSASTLGVLGAKGTTMMQKRDLANYVLDGRKPTFDDGARYTVGQWGEMARLGKWLYDNRSQLIADAPLVIGHSSALLNRTDQEYAKLYTPYPGMNAEQFASMMRQNVAAKMPLPNGGSRGRDVPTPASTLSIPARR
ncbi:MAG: hypothetical protein JST22_21160, partial [Bacteroidetes bacterium]|nr:hypothetical protein [Bacteroidota bacterium]